MNTVSWLAAIGLALVAAAPPAIAATITLDAERNGDAIEVNAVAMLDADGATAWRVLTDYAHYTAFIPDLRSSQVIAHHDRTVTVQQSGDAVFWLVHVPIDITFEIHEAPPDKLDSRAVAGTLPALSSSYALIPTAKGTRMTYAGHVVPGFALLGSIEQEVVRKNIARQFQALADEIERQSMAVPR